MNVMQLTCAGALVVVFGVAAFSKVRSRDAFRAFVSGLSAFGVPAVLARPSLGAAVVAAEVLCAAAVVGAPTWGFAFSAAVLAAFTAGLWHVLRSGARVACRCFGASLSPVSGVQVVRNACLLGVCAVGAWAGSLEGAPAPVALQVVAAAGGAVLGVVFTRWDDLVFLVRPTRLP